MSERNTFQVHANVNSDFGDSALRVTLTRYDVDGHEITTKTWRKHVKSLDFDGEEWQAYSAVVELARMMAWYANTELSDHIAELDEPLF